MTPRLLPEWLQSNCNKAFPFDQQTAVQNELLTDALVLVAGMHTPTVWLDKITDNADSVSLFFKVSDAADYDNALTVATAVVLPKNLSDFEAVEHIIVFGDVNQYMLQITLTIGTNKALNTCSSTMLGSTGKLYNGCVQSVSDMMTRLIVGDSIYAGDVTLVEGDGIELTPSIDDDGKARITVSVRGYRDELGQVDPIYDDDTLVEQAIALIGRPITSINNVTPDSAGNISIAVPSDTTDDGTQRYLYVEASGSNGALQLTVPGYIYTDNYVNTMTDSVVNNIGALNERLGTIQAFCTSLETALNFINTQLARIK